MLDERLLQGGQRRRRVPCRPSIVVTAHPVEVDRQQEARVHGQAVHEHRAGAALAQAAPLLRAGQQQVFAQDLEQRVGGPHRQSMLLAVDRERHQLLHPRAPFSSDALDRCSSARTTSSGVMGSDVNRTPMASSIAPAMAAGTGGCPSSATPFAP